MALTIRIDPEHVLSLQRAATAVRAEKAMCERWGLFVPIEMALTIDDLEEIIDRVEAALRDKARTDAINLTEGGRRPW